MVLFGKRAVACRDLEFCCAEGGRWDLRRYFSCRFALSLTAASVFVSVQGGDARSFVRSLVGSEARTTDTRPGRKRQREEKIDRRGRRRSIVHAIIGFIFNYALQAA